jgi:hypothetical protein
MASATPVAAAQEARGVQEARQAAAEPAEPVGLEATAIRIATVRPAPLEASVRMAAPAAPASPVRAA